MIPLAITDFLGNWWRVGAAFLFGCLLTAPLAYCKGESAAKARADAARAEANVEAMKTNQGAHDKAAEERVKDAATVTAKEEVLIDAIETTPDTAPDAVRVRLGCARLRAQGTDITAISACR